MFSSLLKIIPKLDTAALRNMERTLSSRFTKIAKGFGKGIGNAFKGGAIAGIAMTIIDKLLNPLKEAQEAIDRMLDKSDDVVTNAKQFESNAGALQKLIALGEATGLEKENMMLLISKFQNAVAEAKEDPKKPSAVRAFTDIPDTVEGFFEFIQSLQKMDKDKQILVQQSVFGEKQQLKMSDFLNANFEALFKDLELDKIDSKKLTQDITKLGDLKDLQDLLAAKRNLKDFSPKARLINEGLIKSRDVTEKQLLQRENKRIASYDNLAAIAQTAEKVSQLMEDGVMKIGEGINYLIPKINSLLEYVDEIRKSRFLKGWFGKGP